MKLPNLGGKPKALLTPHQVFLAQIDARGRERTEEREKRIAQRKADEDELKRRLRLYGCA